MSDQNPFDDDQDQTTPAPASDFFASGSPSCRFNYIGDTHIGKIVTFDETQQKDIATGALKFWPDGNPRQMLVITLATNERDAEIDDDDGQRRLYVNKPSGMFAAIKVAIGKNKFAAGGTLAIKYVQNGQPKQAGFSPPKEYTAKYTPAGLVSFWKDASRGVVSAVLVPGGHWTWEESVAKCAAGGITLAQLKIKMQNLGLGGYSPSRDTGTIKELIAAHKQYSGGKRPDSDFVASGRPGPEVLDGPGVPEDEIPY